MIQKVLLADSYNTRLSLFRISDGTLLRHMVSLGSSAAASGIPPSFHQHAGITAVTVVPAMLMGNPEPLILVTDCIHNCVYVLTSTGAVVNIFEGNQHIKLGRLLNGVTVSPLTGEVMVTDQVNQRIGSVVAWKLSNGSGLRVVCSNTGGAPRQFGIPQGIVASKNGQQLWVADSENERLCLFKL